MGFLSFAFAGGGFLLIGAHEALNSTSSSPKQDSQTNTSPCQFHSQTSLFFSILISIFSLFFIVNSLVSLIDAHNSNDAVGSALQFQVISVALLFLFYSILPLFKNCLPLPTTLLGLVGAFAFLEEFLVFYLQRKDPTGVENRYYDLLLVPIAVCVFSTAMELKSPRSHVPKLARAVGLILQGTWFLQIGFSLFSGWVAQGCSLHWVSRGNYTLRCNGHPEYHRARAIATLQFNCHLALLVVVFVGLFSIISRKNVGGCGAVDSSKYRPLGAELQSMENSANFNLDSDEDDGGDEIKEGNVASQKAIGVHVMNGHGSHH